MKYNKDTSEKILENAFEEFGENGYSGARMQSIADRAGINKALLHYYYKSKDALFELVMKKAFQLMIPKLMKTFNSDDSVIENIEKFVEIYIETITKHPQIPGFVIHEISNKPERLVRLIQSTEINFDLLKSKIQMEMDEGKIRKMKPEQLIVNVMALCVFPFMAKPLITGLLLDGDKKAYKALIEERKSEVADFIIRSIQVENSDDKKY